MLLHDSRLGDKCLGKADIAVGRLFELQSSMQPNEGEYHFTVDRDATIDNLTI